MAYQLEPLRKALLLPRVNLFIADDVGLGKTIEAGLVLRELLMRQKVRKVVVAVPPSIVIQWREELEQRFGLTFVVYDREFVARMRRERGYGINPWTTHSRFILSHALLRDEEYATPLRDWLGVFDPGSLLILDEAHHAAPASSAKYAIDSHFTRAVRDIAPRFEHRLFLSATPHNGLSNSFSALMEILDAQRFCRGVAIDPKLRDTVMVRRLKSDLREISGGFAERKVIREELRDLPNDTPELALSRLLDRYWDLREERLATLTPAARAAQGLVLINLQKRLLSSVEAFARTLRAHKKSVQQKATQPSKTEDSPRLWDERAASLDAALAADDAHAEVDETEVEAEAEATVEQASRVLQGVRPVTPDELDLLARMEEIAEAARRQPDTRVRWLITWLRKELCGGISMVPGSAGDATTPWKAKRVVIFTEYADTKRYLEQQLRTALAGTDRADERIATFHGGMPDDLREDIKRAFNAAPAEHPLRILIATDAAREGVNLQNHCADLFHFDLPWNPSRMEQRNGRIDRKGQRAEQVRCHYFVYAQRDADRVLEVLVERTKTIQEELGSLPPVLEETMTRALERGLAPKRRAEIKEQLRAKTKTVKNRTVETELEGARERTMALQKQIDELRNILDGSRRSLDLNEGQLRNALSSSLQLLGAEPLRALPQFPDACEVPALDRRPGADPTWADTMDTLRAPRARGVTLWDWRRAAPVRPVVFKDPGHIDDKVVHLHLEHRLVQRLLGRFLAQGFLLDDLSRACVGQTADAIPRVLLLGRLSLYGNRASRLHDEVVVVAARWTEAGVRKDGLKPYAEDAQEKAWELLLESLEQERPKPAPPEVVTKLRASTPQDVSELLPHLETRCGMLAERATAKLRERGEREAKEMVAILEGQRKRIEQELKKLADPQLSLEFKDFPEPDRRQLDDNVKYWNARLDSIGEEVIQEPVRIRQSYSVLAHRIEPVGIAYLWPVSG
jgi:superfamily II DNA or RNA helicase